MPVPVCLLPILYENVSLYCWQYSYHWPFYFCPSWTLHAIFKNLYFPQWLVKLNIFFSCYWPFSLHFCELPVHTLCLFFFLSGYISLVDFRSCLYIPDINTLLHILHTFFSVSFFNFVISSFMFSWFFSWGKIYIQ